VSRRRDSPTQHNEIKELEMAISKPRLARVPGSHHVVVAGPKGGTGKTTTAAMLALCFAELRGEIVSVLDATTQLGTLRRRLVSVGEPSTRPFRELCARALDGDVLPEWSALAPYVDVVNGLRVLRSLSSPTGDESLTPAEYAAGVALLRHAGDIVVSDVGARANGPVAVAALDSASTLVLATEFAYDALELTIEMVSALAGQPLTYRPDPDDWSAVDDGRFAPLVAGSVVVVAPGRQQSGGTDRRDVNLRAMTEWLRVVCGGGIVMVNHDDHLNLGDRIVLGELELDTAVAYLRVAAVIAARFPLTEVNE
jgi:MinD-like ATPase involved in chromosome partitioning or flagellar assembly